MIPNSQERADRLDDGVQVSGTGTDPEQRALIISPTPDITTLRSKHTASVELRLGT